MINFFRLGIFMENIPENAETSDFRSFLSSFANFVP